MSGRESTLKTKSINTGIWRTTYPNQRESESHKGRCVWRQRERVEAEQSCKQVKRQSKDSASEGRKNERVLWIILHLSHWSTGKTTRRSFYHLCPGPGHFIWGKSTTTTASSPPLFFWCSTYDRNGINNISLSFNMYYYKVLHEEKESSVRRNVTVTCVSWCVVHHRVITSCILKKNDELEAGLWLFTHLRWTEPNFCVRK